MTETEKKVQLVHNKSETIVNLISLGASAVFMYLLYNPNAVERIKGLAQSFWEKLLFQSEVRSTREAINSLPVTDVTDITGNNGQ